MECGVCGGKDFVSNKVLWPRLIDEWQLSPAEVDYIDRQQGKRCKTCSANLRSIALANALRSYLGTSRFLREAAQLPGSQGISILEINAAGSLTPVLKTFGRHVFASYPQVDIHALPYERDAFDVVIHSDTLEHVEHPVHALRECRRVLKPQGALCFTVPAVVGRMSRNRHGLPKSYHGNPAASADDHTVHTEFGADFWTYVFEAGFAEATIFAVEYPAALALMARGHGS